MDFTFLLVMVALVAVFYLLVLRPQRARQKKQQEMLNSVQPGMRVMTTAGLYGTVTDVAEKDFGMEVAPGVVVRHVRAALAQIIEADDDTTSAPDDAAGPELSK